MSYHRERFTQAYMDLWRTTILDRLDSSYRSIRPHISFYSSYLFSSFMAKVIDDAKTIQIKAFGSDVSFNEYNFCWTGDGLRLDYFDKIEENKYNIKTPTFVHRPEGDDGEAPSPMTFYMNGVKDKLQTFHILDCADDPHWTLIKTGGKPYSPVFTGDGVHFTRVEDRYYDSDTETYHFSFTPTTDIVEVSRYFPMNYSETEQWVQSKNNISPHMNISVAGYSKEERNISMIELTNFSIPETQKKRIVVISQQHTSENFGTWMMKGAVDYILTNQDLLDTIHWYFIPLMNPDGLYYQVARNTLDGVDLNRAWDKNIGQTGYAIEVASVREILSAINNERSITAFVDMHNLLSGDWGHFIYSYVCPDMWISTYASLNVFPLPLTCNASALGANLASGWAYYSLGIVNSFLYEMAEMDWRITDTMLNQQGQAFAQSLYQAYR